MADKNYLDFQGLSAYDEKIKNKIALGDTAILAAAKDYVDNHHDDTKQEKIEFNTTYDSSTNKVATMADITNAINNIPKYTDLS